MPIAAGSDYMQRAETPASCTIPAHNSPMTCNTAGGAWTPATSGAGTVGMMLSTGADPVNGWHIGSGETKLPFGYQQNTSIGTFSGVTFTSVGGMGCASTPLLVVVVALEMPLGACEAVADGVQARGDPDATTCIDAPGTGVPPGTETLLGACF